MCTDYMQKTPTILYKGYELSTDFGIQGGVLEPIPHGFWGMTVQADFCPCG